MDMAKRHLSIGDKLIIGDDEFNLKPLRTQDLPKLLAVMKEFNKFKDEPESVFEALDEPTSQKVTSLVLNMIKYSYPDWDDEVTDSFVMSNFLVLLPKMFEINSLSSNMDREQLAKLKRLQAKQRAGHTKKV